MLGVQLISLQALRGSVFEWPRAPPEIPLQIAKLGNCPPQNVTECVDTYHKCSCGAGGEYRGKKKKKKMKIRDDNIHA